MNKEGFFNDSLNVEKPIEERDYKLEKEKYIELTTAKVNSYINEMKRLEHENDFIREDSYHGIKAPHHMMYKLKTSKDGQTALISKDGNRGYEFLIEFDKNDPNYGIYFGCKGLILQGNQKEQIDIFIKEWEYIKDEVTNVLNNTFADIDFTYRYFPTDNAENRTFWPFWIGLHENEDIIKVGARATKLIKNLYSIILIGGGILTKKKNNDGRRKKRAIKTYYTDEAYDALIHDLGSPERVHKFEKFLEAATKENILEVDPRYEKCWKVKSMTNVDFAYLIAELCKHLDLPKKSNVWSCLTRVFLSKSDKRFDQIRKSFNFSKQNTDQTDSKGRSRMDFPKEFCTKIFNNKEDE